MAHEAPPLPPRYTLTVHDAVSGTHGYSPDLSTLEEVHRWLDATLGASKPSPRALTTREVNAAHVHGLNRLQAAVLASVTKAPGRTADIIQRFPESSPSSIRARLSQLASMGHLVRGKGGVYRAAKRQP